jgi:hypothetical protein
VAVVGSVTNKADDRESAGGDKIVKIETAVLLEIGVGPKRTSKEQQAAVRAAVRGAVYDAPSLWPK